MLNAAQINYGLHFVTLWIIKLNIRNIDHIALNCIDLPGSLDFYGRILGFKQLQTIDCGDFNIIYFALPNGSRLELFDYRGKNREVERKDDDSGLRHVAFQVEDVAAHEKLLRAEGVRSHFQPAICQTLEHACCCFWTPME